MAGITSSIVPKKEIDVVFGYLREDGTLFIDAESSGGVLRFYGINSRHENIVVDTFDANPHGGAEKWGNKKVRIKSIHFELEEV